MNDRGGTDFRALRAGQEVAQVRLRLPGRHNVLNALGALGAAVALGVAPADAAAALSSFAGTGRRIEVKGTVGGVLVVDDYGHHPTEIAATLAALRDQWPGRRLVVVFQPHTYTRTRSFLAEFAQALAAADAVIVCAIYAARERNTLGISSQDLVNRLDALAPGKAHFAPTLAAAAAQARALLCPGDILLTLGAGDVYRVGDEVLSFGF